jgi:hypothetical protein
MYKTIIFLSLLTYCAEIDYINDKMHGEVKPTYALVVGVSNYRNLDKLINPKNDAEDMANVLSDYGFTVIKLIDPNKREFEKNIIDFQQKIMNRKGAVLFYYSGHGIQSNGINYLLPRDVDFNNNEDLKTFINFNSILEIIKKANNPVNILILDTCRNNPLSESSVGISRGLRPITKPKSLPPAPEETIISYATSPGRTADDGDTKNGVYTEALLDSLKNSNLDISKIFNKTIKLVKDRTGGKQAPWIESSLSRDFYFTESKKGKIINPKIMEKDLQKEDYLSTQSACVDGSQSWFKNEKSCKEDTNSNTSYSNAISHTSSNSNQTTNNYPIIDKRDPIKVNGLEWSEYIGVKSWNQANDYCKNVKKMRLPTKSELKKLFETNYSNLFQPDDWHWSSNEVFGGIMAIGKVPQKAYDVFLLRGIVGESLKAEGRNFRCVK